MSKAYTNNLHHNYTYLKVVLRHDETVEITYLFSKGSHSAKKLDSKIKLVLAINWSLFMQIVKLFIKFKIFLFLILCGILSLICFLQRIKSRFENVSLIAEVIPFSWSVQILNKSSTAKLIFLSSVNDKLRFLKCFKK